MMAIRNLLAGLGASALVLGFGVGAANAADLSPAYTPPPATTYTPPPSWSWTGPYAGLVGGYGWATPGNGWEGGAYIGYNVQTNSHLVLGVEGDLLAAGKTDNNWDATLRGRVGYAVNKVLIYGTGGVAFGGVQNAGASATNTGWTAGAGIEAAVTQNVTARVEYRHTDLGGLPAGGGDYSSNDLLVGVGFKF